MSGKLSIPDLELIYDELARAIGNPPFLQGAQK